MREPGSAGTAWAALCFSAGFPARVMQKHGTEGYKAAKWSLSSCFIEATIETVTTV